MCPRQPSSYECMCFSHTHSRASMQVLEGLLARYEDSQGGEVTSRDAFHADARSLAGRDHPFTLPGAGSADPFQLAVQDAAQLSQR